MGKTFELRVEFAGLCLYVDHRSAKSGTAVPGDVTILMPDARKTVDPVHADGARGDAHTGYIRFDLANVLAALSVQNAKQPEAFAAAGEVDEGTGSPPNEVIHRFDFELLDFGLAPASAKAAGRLVGDIKVPRFDDFTDEISPIAEALTEKPAEPAFLMRTTISGGRMDAQPSGKTWGFSPVLKYQRNGGYSGNFAGFVVWTRELDEDAFPNGLVVRIRKIDGSGETAIPLKPVTMRGTDDSAPKQRITIKVANLCADNPLEWNEFRLRNVVDRDIDFKWLYRLLKSDNATALQDRLENAELPFPREVSVQAYGDEDCMGGSISYPR